MRACGDCRFFRNHSLAADGTWIGDCRHQPQRGDFRPDAPTCGSYLSLAAPIPQTMPEQPTRRARVLTGFTEPTVRRHGNAHALPGAAPAPQHPAPPGVLANLGDLTDMTREELKAVLREVLEEGDVQLAPKWEGGSVLLKPRDPTLQPREIPIDQLLHKVVMVRDRLRVLEAKINANPKLSDAEKVDFQQYVTRCYGSLTTFNQLFRDKADHFVGEKTD